MADYVIGGGLGFVGFNAVVDDNSTVRSFSASSLGLQFTSTWDQYGEYSGWSLGLGGRIGAQVGKIGTQGAASHHFLGSDKDGVAITRQGVTARVGIAKYGELKTTTYPGFGKAHYYKGEKVFGVSRNGNKTYVTRKTRQGLVTSTYNRNGALEHTEAQRSDAHCFPANTSIALAGNIAKPIETIQPGDTILAFDPASHNGRGALVPRRVIRLFSNITEEWITLSNGVTVTPGHRFLTPDGGFAVIDLAADGSVGADGVTDQTDELQAANDNGEVQALAA